MQWPLFMPSMDFVRCVCCCQFEVFSPFQVLPDFSPYVFARVFRCFYIFLWARRVRYVNANDVNYCSTARLLCFAIV